MFYINFIMNLQCISWCWQLFISEESQ